MVAIVRQKRFEISPLKIDFFCVHGYIILRLFKCIGGSFVFLVMLLQLVLTLE